MCNITYIFCLIQWRIFSYDSVACRQRWERNGQKHSNPIQLPFYARQSCKTKGGDLAVMTSYEMIDSIKAYLVDVGEYWVGAKNPSKKKDSWKWLSGEPIPMSFARWRTREPTGDNDCLTYHKYNNEKDGEGLCDHNCSEKADGYICQIRTKWWLWKKHVSTANSRSDG